MTSADPPGTVRSVEIATPETVLAVRGVRKQFGSSVRAVDDLTFSVERGQVCGLLGPNGAGKSTTLRILLGLVHADAGEVELLGRPAGPGCAALARVGALVEQAAFVPHVSGLTNLCLYWEAGGASIGAADLDGALAVAGLGETIHRKVKTYSQGMRQRLGLARALLGRPELLVLDEPTNGLDPQEVRAVRELIRRAAVDRRTVLLSSHLLGEVEQVCSHVVVMDRGGLVVAGPVRELMGRATTAYVEVDDVPAASRQLAAMPGVRGVRPEPPGLSVDLDGACRADLVRTLVCAGIAVDTVTARHGLEDAFLGLVGEETVR